VQLPAGKTGRRVGGSASSHFQVANIIPAWVPEIYKDQKNAGRLTRVRHILPRFWKFMCYLHQSMAMQKKNAFSRRLPDLVTEELVTVLSQKKSFEFKQLFEIVHENLRQRNAASGGEEMLRLRAYEKLQNLVARGVVKKTGKIYKGDSSALAAMTAANVAQAAAAIAAKS
jgi:hypothetical protein